MVIHGRKINILRQEMKMLSNGQIDLGTCILNAAGEQLKTGVMLTQKDRSLCGRVECLVFRINEFFCGQMYKEVRIKKIVRIGN